MRGLLISAVGLALAAHAATAQPTAPMVKPDGIVAVSAHVLVIPDNSTPVVPNVGFIVGDRAVLVVDTGLGPANGAIVAAAAQKAAPGRTIYLVATHAHPEHDMGAQAFPAGSKLIRSKDQAGDEAGDQRVAGLFSKMSPAMADLLKDAQFRKADITFTTTYSLDLGGVIAQVIALGPNHTPGDTAVWVAADKVLFSGDVAMKAQPAMMAPETTLARWRMSLDLFEALNPAVVVPSHGPVGDVGFIRGYRDYLAEVAKRTGEAKAAGQTVEQATTTVSEAMAARYPDKGRLAGAVRVAYASAK